MRRRRTPTKRKRRRRVTLARLTAAAALKGEEVGVVTIAAQAQVRPPDVVAAMRVQDQLAVRQLHHAGAQLVPIVVHVDHLPSDGWPRGGGGGGGAPLRRERGTPRAHGDNLRSALGEPTLNLL